MIWRRIMPPDYAILSIILIVLLHYLFPIMEIISYPWKLSGIFLMAGAFLVGAYAVKQFLKADTPIKPFSKPTALIESGPFRFSRNPIYLAGLLLVTGVAVLFGSASGFLLPPLYFLILHYLFVLPEERLMRRKFAAVFTSYCQKTRRWL